MDNYSAVFLERMLYTNGIISTRCNTEPFVGSGSNKVNKINLSFFKGVTKTLSKYSGQISINKIILVKRKSDTLQNMSNFSKERTEIYKNIYKRYY